MKDLRGDTDSKHRDRAEVRLGRTAAAQLIGVTRSTIGRMVARGELHPTIDSEGVHAFDVGEVVKVATSRRANAATSPTDEVGARAFELFADYVSLREVVLRLRLAPSRVAELYAQWRKFGTRSDMWLTPEHQQSLAEIVHFDTSADLVDAVRGLVAARDEMRSELEKLRTLKCDASRDPPAPHGAPIED